MGRPFSLVRTDAEIQPGEEGGGGEDSTNCCALILHTLMLHRILPVATF